MASVVLVEGAALRSAGRAASGESAEHLVEMAEHDVTGQLGELRMPTTVIAGSADTSSPAENLRAMATAIPGARFVVLRGPHMLHLEQPDAFAEALRAHRAWVGAAG